MHARTAIRTIITEANGPDDDEVDEERSAVAMQDFFMKCAKSFSEVRVVLYKVVCVHVVVSQVV